MNYKVLLTDGRTEVFYAFSMADAYEKANRYWPGRVRNVILA